LGNLAYTAETADIFLQQIESRCDLLQYKLENWCIWPIFRFPIAMKLLDLPWTLISDNEKLLISERIKIAGQDLLGILKIRSAKYLVFVNSSNRADFDNNLHHDIYFDDLLPHIESFVKLENINNKQYYYRGKSAQYPSLITTNGFYIIAGLFAKLIQTRNIKNITNTFHLVFSNEFDIHDLHSSRISFMLQSYYWRKKIFKWFIKKFQFNNLLLINAYNNHPLVSAAKENGVEVIEFQHGIIYNHHPGYSWTKYALPYKRNMPIPDKIFVYGDYWKNQLLSEGFWGEEVRSIGSLRIDKYRIIKNDNKSDKICKLVVTTQGLDIDRMNNFLIEFLEAIQGRLPVQLSIKLHPREHIKKPYENAFRGHKNVSIILGAEPPSTFDLLSQADFHISISSTCHYEALGIGIQTIILPLANHEKTLHLQSSGFAYNPENPQQMSEIVLRNFGKEVPVGIGSEYFKPNALKNMMSNLDI
jgi:hypothetical protein